MNRKPKVAALIGLLLTAVLIIFIGVRITQEFNKYDQAILEKEKVISVMEKKVSTQNNTIAGLENEVAKATEEKTILDNSLNNKETELQQSKERIDSLQNELSKAQADLDNARKEVKNLQAKKDEPAGDIPPSDGGRTLTVKATAYTAHPSENGGTYGGRVLTKTGYDLSANPSAKVIAVDPSVIPLGSKVWVEGYGEAMALDTGGAIKGNRVDLLMPSFQASESWGVRNVQLKVLN